MISDKFHILAVAGTIYAFAIAGCAIDGSPTSEPKEDLSTSTTRAAEQKTPDYPSKWPHRRNRGNDGTAYEPCTALTDSAATALGIEISSREDAAIVDGQTARGCNWLLAEGRWWSLSQIVGNSPSLQRYKVTQSGYWRPDISYSNRVVGVNELNSSICSTHVQSGRAIVTTIAQYDSLPTPPIDEICSRAIAFTKATIDKMPP